MSGEWHFKPQQPKTESSDGKCMVRSGIHIGQINHREENFTSVSLGDQVESSYSGSNSNDEVRRRMKSLGWRGGEGV